MDAAEIYVPTFSPAEAATMTGVSTSLQRKWRSAGGPLEPKETAGWTRWTPQELARLLVLSRLAKLIGPAKAAEVITSPDNVGMAELVHAYAVLLSVKGDTDKLSGGFGRFMVSEGGKPFKLFKDAASGIGRAAEPYLILDALALGQHLANQTGPLAYAGPDLS
nr:MAG TPA: helix-turn-helix domain protein [Caudoviricetes sp.]